MTHEISPRSIVKVVCLLFSLPACQGELSVTTPDAGVLGTPSRGSVVSQTPGTDASSERDSVPSTFSDTLATTPDLGVEGHGTEDQKPDVIARPDLILLPDLGSVPEAFVRGDTLPNIPDAGIDTGPDTVQATPDVLPPRPEVGKEAPFVCPATCFQGCYSGCGPDNQCKACLTCTCEGATGICHC